MATDNKNFQYFIRNHEDIYKRYPNSYVVIADEEVVLSENSFENALSKALQKGLEPGSFLIQECTEGTDAYTQEFHSRVIFS